jgi:hypothetical protein
MNCPQCRQPMTASGKTFFCVSCREFVLFFTVSKKFDADAVCGGQHRQLSVEEGHWTTPGKFTALEQRSPSGPLPG